MAVGDDTALPVQPESVDGPAGLDPAQVVRELALQKGRRVRTAHPQKTRVDEWKCEGGPVEIIHI
jgi:hypothetical protein